MNPTTFPKCSVSGCTYERDGNSEYCKRHQNYDIQVVLTHPTGLNEKSRFVIQFAPQVRGLNNSTIILSEEMAAKIHGALGEMIYSGKDEQKFICDNSI